MEKKSSQFSDFLQNIHPEASKYLLPMGVAAAAGGLGAGVLTARGDERPEEDKEERRMRILQNALKGTAMAGTAAGLGTYGYNQLSTPLEPGDPGAMSNLARSPALMGGLAGGSYFGLGLFPSMDVVDQARRQALTVAGTDLKERASRAHVRDLFNARKGHLGQFRQEVIDGANRGRTIMPTAKLTDLLRRSGLAVNSDYNQAKILPSWAKRLGMTEGRKVPNFLQRMKALRLGSGPAKKRLALAVALGLAPALGSAIL